MTSFLIARLPPHPKSLEAVDFMQKNDFFFRISSNPRSFDLLMTSGQRFATDVGLSDEFKPGDEEKELMKQFKNILSAEVKEEVDSDVEHQPKNNVDATKVKEEVISDVEQDDTTEVSVSQPAPFGHSQIQPVAVFVERVVREENGQPDEHHPRLEMSSVAEQTVESTDIPIVTARNPLSLMDAGHAEEEVVDDHQEEREEEISSFLNQPPNDEGMNEGVLLTEEHKFDGNNAEIPFDLPLTVAESDVQAVRTVVEEEEEREEQDFLGEKDGEEDEFNNMSVDELLGSVDAEASTISPSVQYNEDDLLVSFDDDSRMGDEEEENSGGNEYMEQFEEEEEELTEEQGYEEEEKNSADQHIDENSGVDQMEREENDADERPGNHAGRLLFTCLFKNCSASYNSFEKLEKHMNDHPNKHYFFCDVCKKSFSSKDDAMAHIQERKTKECCGCGKKCSRTHDMIRHYRCHTGERPFVCKTCGKGFTQTSSLNNHSLTHTGMKPFFCGYCKKRFALKGNLERHGRTHTGEKPFECKDCGRTFGYKHNLDEHIRLRTGQTPLCTKCGAAFCRNDDLKKHMKNKHPN